MGNTLTIVIPAYNEEESLLQFLPEVIEFCKHKFVSLIIINDGSIDNTKKILDKYSAQNEIIKVIHHKVNRGYGGAIKSGIINANTDYIITIDADGQHSLSDVEKLYDLIIKEDADMIVGNRKGQKDASFFRKLGKMSIRFIAKRLMPLNIHDINSGMKIYNTQLAKKYISLCPDTMAFSDTILLAFVYQRHLVIEEPISINKRIAGESTISLSTAFETLKEILNIIVLFNPMRIFIPVAIVFFITGIAWGIPFLINGKGVSVGAGILMIMAILIFLLSLIAEQLSTLNKNMNK